MQINPRAEPAVKQGEKRLMVKVIKAIGLGNKQGKVLLYTTMYLLFELMFDRKCCLFSDCLRRTCRLFRAVLCDWSRRPVPKETNVDQEEHVVTAMERKLYIVNIYFSMRATITYSAWEELFGFAFNFRECIDGILFFLNFKNHWFYYLIDFYSFFL